jgi:hypothetical protein
MKRFEHLCFDQHLYDIKCNLQILGLIAIFDLGLQSDDVAMARQFYVALLSRSSDKMPRGRLSAAFALLGDFGQTALSMLWNLPV